jgi:hypothetical protein
MLKGAIIGRRFPFGVDCILAPIAIRCYPVIRHRHYSARDIMDPAHPSLSHPSVMINSASASLLSPPPSGLKRRASEDSIVGGDRKRLREDTGDRGHAEALGESPFIQELADELQCGCCAALVYKPVLVLPCQHFFCGRYASTYRYQVA